MAKAAKPATASRSPSSRRAWIEMLTGYCRLCGEVALLAEGVDRNRMREMVCAGVSVALLAEGVDRNQLKRSANP